MVRGLSARTKKNGGKCEVGAEVFDVDRLAPDDREALQSMLLHGIDASDSRGHTESMSIRCSPHLMAILGRVREAAPEGWYDSRAHFIRSMILGGCLILNKLIQPDKRNDELERIYETMADLCKIARKIRLEELYEHARTLKQTMQVREGDGDKAAEKQLDKAVRFFETENRRG